MKAEKISEFELMNENEMELYFGAKALNDAMLTGHNQIFLSASNLESDAIREHVIKLANSLGVAVTGNPIVLQNGAKLIFLLTDSQVMAAHSGNAYAINCFDDMNFSYVSNLVSSWAMLKKHRVIFFSTS
ncbi:terminase family protein [Shewanella sp. D64]|uniref:terminase large subunit domain-containing protein n=1 Tax=unclassified Shewanella TaxID=196818 RepID=UPI0022BA528C|nr:MULTISPECIES: terminase family protein [unclassified Shewanella]MEC4728160.1 terminase family protein [Shewanella sp. D64]MEC4740280.1 terminase family protein [Shewanella sp. E94]WBJ94405.1 terminase family protein [Shewanella sp. MTB7]